MAPPPSSTSICPVMYAASSEARYRTAAAMSSGVPTRPTGRRLPRRASSAATSRSGSVLSTERLVPNAPGLIELTVIPQAATSIANARVSPMTPALDAAYGVE